MNSVSAQPHHGDDEVVIDPIATEREPIRDSTEILMESLAALMQPTAAAASSVHLNWISLLHTGTVSMGDQHYVHHFYFDLNSLNTNAAALLVFAAREVDFWKNFITLNWNSPTVFSFNATYEQAENSPWFVTTIFRSAGVDYSWQVHRIGPGKLRHTLNDLAFHARDVDGTRNSNIDDFWISRIFLIYSMGV